MQALTLAVSPPTRRRIYTKDTSSKPKRSAWKGIVAGAVGGFAASWVMGQFHALSNKAIGKVTSKETFRELQRAAADAQEATAKVADRVSQPLLRRKLRYSEKQRAKPIVHYAFGSAVGAVYGATAEYRPIVRKFAGAPFGAAVFAGADQLALPALHLTRKPTEYPPALHATEFGAHIVYGVTLESVRRLVRLILRA